MEQLKAMLTQLKACVGAQMGNLAEADTHELGEAVDMIKDLEEAMYYRSIVKAMEKREKEEEEHKEEKKQHHHHYYTETYYPYPIDMDDMGYDHHRDMDREMGRMYYQGRDSRGRFTSGRGGRSGYSDDRIYYTSPSSMGGRSGSGSVSNGGHSGMSGGHSSHGYEERPYPAEMRDYREGSSPVRRRYYMEAKEQNQDKKAQMEELEKYMKELSKDLTEMIQDASPEETMLLKQKLSTLAEKIK